MKMLTSFCHQLLCFLHRYTLDSLRFHQFSPRLATTVFTGCNLSDSCSTPCPIPYTVLHVRMGMVSVSCLSRLRCRAQLLSKSLTSCAKSDFGPSGSAYAILILAVLGSGRTAGHEPAAYSALDAQSSRHWKMERMCRFRFGFSHSRRPTSSLSVTRLQHPNVNSSTFNVRLRRACLAVSTYVHSAGKLTTWSCGTIVPLTFSAWSRHGTTRSPSPFAAYARLAPSR